MGRVGWERSPVVKKKILLTFEQLLRFQMSQRPSPNSSASVAVDPPPFFHLPPLQWNILFHQHDWRHSTGMATPCLCWWWSKDALPSFEAVPHSDDGPSALQSPSFEHLWVSWSCRQVEPQGLEPLHKPRYKKNNTQSSIQKAATQKRVSGCWRDINYREALDPFREGSRQRKGIYCMQFLS